MTIYKRIMQTNGREVSAQVLPLGEHKLEHGGASVFVSVDKEERVTVHLETFRGKPEDLWLPGLDMDRTERLINEGRYSAVIVKPKIGETAVALQGVDQGLDTELVLHRMVDRPLISREKAQA